VRRAPDIGRVVSGLAVTALGVLLLLAEAGVLHLHFNYAAPAVLATVGVVLLAAGLSRD
jgi:hypothetical protein